MACGPSGPPGPEHRVGFSSNSDSQGAVSPKVEPVQGDLTSSPSVESISSTYSDAAVVTDVIAKDQAPTGIRVYDLGEISLDEAIAALVCQVRELVDAKHADDSQQGLTAAQPSNAENGSESVDSVSFTKAEEEEVLSVSESGRALIELLNHIRRNANSAIIHEVSVPAKRLYSVIQGSDHSYGTAASSHVRSANKRVSAASRSSIMMAGAAGQPSLLGGAFEKLKLKGTDSQRSDGTLDSSMVRSATGSSVSIAGSRMSLRSDRAALDALKHQHYPWWFIDPQKPMRVAWDVAGLIIVLVDSVLMPFEMAYRANAKEGPWFWLGTFFFLTDILFNFLTGYVSGPLEKDPGQMVTSPWRIAKNYLRSWFCVDFASTVPWSWLVESVAGSTSDASGSTRMAKIAKIAKLARFMRLARMLKLLKLQSLWESVEMAIGSSFLVQVLQLLKILVFILFLCHWNACIFWALGNPLSLFHGEVTDDDTLRWTQIFHTINVGGEEFTFRWLDRSEVESYLFCFYWTLGVMRTMPVEVYPVNVTERTYTLCFMFFAFSVFSITIAKITTMFTKMRQRRIEFDDTVSALREAMRNGDVPKPLQGRARTFLEHKFVKRRFMAREQLLLGELSEGLRSELHLAKYGPQLQQYWMFESMIGECVAEITLIAETVDAAPGDSLSEAGAIAQVAWFLTQGQLSFHDPFLAEKGFQTKALTDTHRALDKKIRMVDAECLLVSSHTLSFKSIWAAECSELIMIDKQEFIDVRNTHPQIEAHMKMLLASKRGRAFTRRLSAGELGEGSGSTRRRRSSAGGSSSIATIKDSSHNAFPRGAVAHAEKAEQRKAKMLQQQIHEEHERQCNDMSACVGAIAAV